MGLYTGTLVKAEDFKFFPRQTRVVVVNPCGERVSLHLEEAQLLAQRLLDAVAESQQKQVPSSAELKQIRT